MKAASIKLFIFTLVSVFFAGCAKDEVDKPLTDQLKDNTWYVSYYLDSGEDETTNFSGYSISFGDNMLITATKGGASYTGTWFLSDNSSNVNIVMMNTSDYSENLSNDWIVTERTNDVLKLKDNSEFGETLYLMRQ